MKLSDNIRSTIAAVAPTLGAALGGPLGGAAGVFIAKALGTPPGDAKAAEAALVAASPEALVALKKADNDFQAHMADLGVDLERINAGDRDSARKREMAVKDHTPAVLAVFIVAGFFGVLGYLLVEGKPKEGGDALLVMLGGLSTGFAAVLAYYFGSSAGSRSKDDLLFRATPPKA